MEREAFLRVVEAGQLTWDQLNPINFIYYPTTSVTPTEHASEKNNQPSPQPELKPSQTK